MKRNRIQTLNRCFLLVNLIFVILRQIPIKIRNAETISSKSTHIFIFDKVSLYPFYLSSQVIYQIPSQFPLQFLSKFMHYAAYSIPDYIPVLPQFLTHSSFPSNMFYLELYPRYHHIFDSPVPSQHSYYQDFLQITLNGFKGIFSS